MEDNVLTSQKQQLAEAVRKVIDDTNSEMDHYLPAKGETSQECFYRRLTRNMVDFISDQ